MRAGSKEEKIVIEISHLVKKYGDHIAVNDLTLTVEPGKIYGFLGPNGAGKSTTMNIITGYLGATSAGRSKKMCGISAGDPASLCGYDSQGVSELCGRVKETRKKSEK